MKKYTKFLISHENGNPVDNRIENLKWRSIKENCVIKDQHGKIPKGKNNYNTKYSDEYISKIRKMHENDLSGYQIAKQAGMSLSNVYSIINNQARV